jgi:hypothetical protein
VASDAAKQPAFPLKVVESSYKSTDKQQIGFSPVGLREAAFVRRDGRRCRGMDGGGRSHA